MRASFALLAAALLAGPAAAQTGYVVKADSDTVYMDLGAESGVSPGAGFVVFSEGEELKHPVTGASLGRIETEVAAGRVESVFPKYSVGRRAAPGPALAPGARVRLRPAAPAPAAAPQPAAVVGPGAAQPAQFAPAAQTAPQAGALQPFWRSPPLELEAVGVAAADVDGDKESEVVVADSNRVLAFRDAGVQSCASIPCGQWKPSCSYEDRNTTVRFLSVDALDLDGNGKAEAFVTLHNSFMDRVETRVIECRGAAFEAVATLPWMTRAYQAEDGAWRLAAQELVSDHNFPLGTLRELSYSDGRYSTGRSIRARRLEWLYGFAFAKDAPDGPPFHVYVSPTTQRLRVQFKKKSWGSEEAFGQTANRVRWQDRQFNFHPRLLLVQRDGLLSGLYAVRNLAGFGGLAGAFGLYSNAELHRLRWTGLGLESDGKAELGGYAADIAARPAAPGRPAEVLAAVVGRGGRTSILRFASAPAAP